MLLALLLLTANAIAGATAVAHAVRLPLQVVAIAGTAAYVAATVVILLHGWMRGDGHAHARVFLRVCMG